MTGLIRSGGMGTVYDALDRDHATRVALKTLNHLSAESLLRFKNEFRAVADLSHPNLVSLYELGCHDNLWFFTMERIVGVDFIAHLRKGWRRDSAEHRAISPTSPTLVEGVALASREHEPSPSLPRDVPAVRDALAQLVRGVRALHAAGLLHLDLKPSNVLVDRAGRVVVLDFGLIRPIGEAPSSTPSDAESWTISGTPEWMAPEQYVGEGIGEAADWYAVGLMLYLALTGVRPFARASTPVTWYAKLSTRPTPPDQLLAGVPSDLSMLAVALLQSSAKSRPSGDALAALASGGVAPETPIEKPARADLVGRAAERALLSSAVEVAANRGTAVVHLTGPSGVGKSALLDALRDDAKGALVLRGRCYERETVPYKAFDGMLDDLALHLASDGELAPESLPEWIGELVRVFPVLTRVPAIAIRVSDDVPSSGVELRRRAATALRELFATVAARRPLVLAIDDVQWADADSAALLVKLLSPPAPRGMVIAATLRPVEASRNPAIAPYLDAVRDLRGGVHRLAIDVEPLPTDDAEHLARERLAALDVRDDDHALAAAIAKETSGLPFFIEELAHHVAQSRDAGEDRTKGVALESVLARRVRALSRAERALVDVLAVANNPIPLGVALAVANVTSGVVRALWSLRAGHFVRSSGAGTDDRLELHHDRTREAVLGMMSRDEIDDHHLALGRALAARDGDAGAFTFDAVRHLNAVAHRLEGDERTATARLDLAAGRRARHAAAFPLAFDCFRAGARLLGPTAWETDYDVALALHNGAAETAYLSGAWADVDSYVAEVKAHARSILDQRVAWEAQIDACIAKNEYAAAVEAGLDALRSLGVALAANPTEADIGAELGLASAALARVGPVGLAALAPAEDATIVAAMRIASRIASAAYFARPMLLPLLACRLVALSVEHGISPATPYALAIYGIVLNTIGMHRDAHTWGKVALDLVDRFEDRSLEARTRHVVHDLVCVFTVPLAGTLASLREVVAIGKQTGDLEYAAYAAHAYVHNAFYASKKLDALLDEALAFGEFMRGQGQINALHVHAPFEQVLRCFLGRTHDPARLDGDGFEENAALDEARAAGSRSAQHIVRLLMGIVRYHFGSAADASACLEAARPFLDGVASTWHVPMFHQYAALAIHALDAEERRALLPQADASLAALRALAEQGAENFAHRVALVEAARARAEGDLAGAIEHARRAIDGAERGGWLADLGLAHEIAARCHAARSETNAAAEHARDARGAFARWGARANR